MNFLILKRREIANNLCIVLSICDSNNLERAFKKNLNSHYNTFDRFAMLCLVLTLGYYRLQCGLLTAMLSFIL